MFEEAHAEAVAADPINFAHFPTELNAAQTVPVEVPVDIFELFTVYDKLYFQDKLTKFGVQVKWGKKTMTRCAGMCELKGGPYGGIEIRLSPSLLQYRSNSDIKETLLHEMIHANCFLDHTERDRDGHGAHFQRYMHMINGARTMADPYRPFGGYRITVFHNFVQEVRHFQTHVWKCGKCAHVIRRAMNRAPSEKDCRFYRKDLSGWRHNSANVNKCGDRRCYVHNHLRMCGGEYVRISPEPNAKKQVRRNNGSSTSKATAKSRVKTISTKEEKPPKSEENENEEENNEILSKILKYTVGQMRRLPSRKLIQVTTYVGLTTRGFLEKEDYVAALVTWRQNSANASSRNEIGTNKSIDES
mmetsp:Transcript_27716/g.38546  ORF Transcript_27716/g.38546 Transcript_27716/m.38546 type:complete len:359 (-) Transcript_27716:61-1137(-)